MPKFEIRTTRTIEIEEVWHLRLTKREVVDELSLDPSAAASWEEYVGDYVSMLDLPAVAKLYSKEEEAPGDFDNIDVMRL